jgi:predicted metal-dependent phosphoesterase TrpH
LIDLHTHTTASDGRCAPADLVSRAAESGVSVLAVTDHDTIAGCAEASAACACAGITFVNGIEITAVCDGADVHILGYCIDRESASLTHFLADQRHRRFERVREMIRRLVKSGIELDEAAILGPGLIDAGKAVGRPWIARALVEGGHVPNTNEAFDRWLSRGRPAFVPRSGARPPEVINRIHDAGGVASLAHPALVRRDDWIADFVEEGLDAIEAYHSEHDQEATLRYLSFARRHGLAVSGGSDFHADPQHGPQHPGVVALPREHYVELMRRATIRATASGSNTSSENTTSS